MKWPTLPRWRRPALNFAAGAPPWRQLLLGVAAFVLALLLGLLLAFPTAPLKQKVVEAFRQYQASAELESLTLSPLLALQGRNLTIRPDNPSLPPLAVERFSVRPLWLSLLAADPGLHIDAELLQGTLQAATHQDGRLQAEAKGLHVALPLKDGIATVTATLAAGRLQRGAGGGQKADQALSLTFSELLVQSPLLAGSASRPLTLGQLNLEGNGRGQAFNITRLESSGGDVALTGSGSVLLGRTLESSRLNLNLTLRPTPSMPGELRGLLDLLGPPAGDGSYPLKVAGTLASPLLQSPGRARGSEAAPAAGVQGGEGATDAPPASAFGSNRRRAAESDADDE
jgi:type II secretion system protein N